MNNQLYAALSEEEAKKPALIELKSEDEEFKRININIKSNLDKFISMKQDAKKIIAELLPLVKSRLGTMEGIDRLCPTIRHKSSRN